MVSATSANFVDLVFETVLLRAPTASELSSWGTLLDAETLSDAQLISDIVTSPEAGNDVLPIVRIYQAFFERAPDAAGLSYWVNDYRDYLSGSGSGSGSGGA